MVFTRKDGIFMGYVSLPEGNHHLLIGDTSTHSCLLFSPIDILVFSGGVNLKYLPFNPPGKPVAVNFHQLYP